MYTGVSCRCAVWCAVHTLLCSASKVHERLTFNFLVAVPFDDEQKLSTKCPLTSRVGTHSDQSERNAQCITVSANHRFVFFRHTMVLFCVALFFLICPYLTTGELLTPLSQNLLLLVCVVYLLSVHFTKSIFRPCKRLDLTVSMISFRFIFACLFMCVPRPLFLLFLCSLNF